MNYGTDSFTDSFTTPSPSDAQFIDDEIQSSTYGTNARAVIRRAIQALKKEREREQASGKRDLEKAAKLKKKANS